MEKTEKKKTILEKPIFSYESGKYANDHHDFIDITIDTDDDEDSRSFMYEGIKIQRLKSDEVSDQLELVRKIEGKGSNLTR